MELSKYLEEHGKLPTQPIAEQYELPACIRSKVYDHKKMLLDFGLDIVSILSLIHI